MLAKHYSVAVLGIHPEQPLLIVNRPCRAGDLLLVTQKLHEKRTKVIPVVQSSE